LIDDSDLVPNIPDETDSIEAAREIRRLASLAMNPYTDGFTQCTCKRRLYLLKCLIEDLYKDLPEFPGQEKEWEQERLIQLLKRTDQ
jgi:hypothetical protein